MRCKLKHYVSGDSILIDVMTVPELHFEEIELYAPPGAEATWIPGAHHWVPLTIIPTDVPAVQELVNKHGASWMSLRQVEPVNDTYWYCEMVVLMHNGNQLHCKDAKLINREGPFDLKSPLV